MAAPWDTILSVAYDFLKDYVIPNAAVLAITFLTVGLAFVAQGRVRRGSLKKALKGEIKINSKVTKAIVSYADGQLSGDTSVAPMPRYRTAAFMNFVNAGLLDKVPKRIGDELQQIYLSMISVNRAGRRQEELAFGPAAAFPNAHTLRLENLTYARDTAHNIIEPYQDRLGDVKL